MGSQIGKARCADLMFPMLEPKPSPNLKVHVGSADRYLGASPKTAVIKRGSALVCRYLVRREKNRQPRSQAIRVRDAVLAAGLVGDKFDKRQVANARRVAWLMEKGGQVGLGKGQSWTRRNL